MRELSIEWRHYEKEGATCLRCSATGKTLEEVVAELRQELAQQGVKVTFTETKLTEAQLPQSNMILFNGVPLEELLAGVEVSENLCASCACLTARRPSAGPSNTRGRPTRRYPRN